MLRIPIVAILLLGLASAASAQSFDCKKAQTRVEKLVCADARLSELDEHLGRYYAAGRTELEGAASCLQSDQAQWLKSVRDACANEACLTTAYLNRLGELDALQPGATAIKNITLPDVPALVWVIAPAADKVAAPPIAKVQPLEAIGTVVNDVAGGDGFMLRTRSGTNVPLVLLMFLEGKTQEQLAALARQQGATFRARGFSASDGKRTYFEPSRCTFIHRMPATAPRALNDVGPQD
jgi:uncharacterized protein